MAPADPHTLALASDPATPAQMLADLANDEAYVAIVAGNPNTPKETLERLLLRIPRQVFANPVFPLLCLEDPRIVQKPHHLLLEMCRAVNVPDIVLKPLCKSTDRVTQDAVRDHIKIAGEAGDDWEARAQSRIVKRPYHIARDRKPVIHEREVIHNFVQLPDLPLWLLAAFARHSTDSVRCGVARHPSTPRDILAFLAQERWGDVPRAVAENPKVDLAAYLAGKPTISLRFFKEHPFSAEEQQQIMAAARERPVPVEFAANPTLLPNVMEELATSRNDTLRSALARRGDLPEHLYAQFVRDPSNNVRLCVAENPQVPAAFLAELATDSSEYVRRNVARNPTISSATVKVLLETNDSYIWGGLVHNPATTTEALRQLAQHVPDTIRDIVQHPHAPVELVEALAQSADPKDRAAGAASPVLPRAMQEHLSTDNETLVLGNLAGNAAVDEVILAALARTSHSSVAHGLIRNPNTPLDILQKLSLTRDEQTLTLIMGNVGVSLSILMRLAHGDDYTRMVRLLDHPRCTPQVVVEIGQGFVPRIYDWTQGRWQRPKERINEEVAFRLAGHPWATEELRVRVFTHLLACLRPYHDWHRRVSLLACPAVPPAFLAAAVATPDWLERYAIARNPTTPDATLRSLVEDDGNRFVRAAAHAALAARLAVPAPPSTPSSAYDELDAHEVLEHLRTATASPALVAWAQGAESIAVRDAAEDHIALAKGAGKDWERRAASRIKKRPLQFTRKERKQADAIVPWGFCGMPLWLLDLLATHTSMAMRMVVARDSNADPALLGPLISTGNEDMRIAIAKNRGTPPDLLRQLAADLSHRVREAVAEHPHIPDEARAQLAGDDHRYVRHAVAGCPATLPAVLAQLSRDSSDYVRRGVAENPQTPPTILASLAADEDWRVRCAVAQHRQTPPETLASLINDGMPEVQQWAAQHPSLPIAVVNEVIAGGTFRTRLGVAANPALPLDEATEWLSTLVDAVAVGARQEGIEDASVNHFTKIEEARILAAMAANPSATPALLGQLAELPYPIVREAVARNPHTSGDVLAALAREPQIEVRQEVARNPHTSDEVLALLAHDPHNWAASAAQGALHSRVMDDPARRIEAPESVTLRECDALGDVAPHLRAAYFTRLLTETLTPFDEWIDRLFVLASSRVPSAVLDAQSASPDWLDRYAIARNTATPHATLRRLAEEDGNRWVRAVAGARVSGEAHGTAQSS